MPSLTDRLLNALGLQRSTGYVPLDFWGGFSPYFPQSSITNKVEELGSGYGSLIAGAYAANPIVFACMNARVQLFSEARFLFQRMDKGVPGELFQGPSTYLRLLEEPWPGGTTSQLLSDALLDADLAGNAFIARRPSTLQRLRPDWVTIIAGNPRSDGTTWDLDTEVLGYGYQPGGPAAGQEKVYLQASEVAHFKSTHDPSRRFSGMSWLVPIIREITSDQAAASFKLKFYENGATPNMVISFDPTKTRQEAEEWIELFKKDHVGTRNAYKTLFLGGGSKAEVVGANLRQSDFSSVQAAGELRIASAAGVPPIVVGLSGGLEAATYSNYGQARRAFADLTMRPLWRDMAGALERIITVPENARLWFDARDISFLQEDVRDAADIQAAQASTIRQLVDGGFKPESVVEAVIGGDFNRLEHTSLFSVQLQPSGADMTGGEDTEKLIAQLNAGLLTHDEARELLKRPPIKWSEDLSPEEIASLLEQVKAGVRTENEVRTLMKLPPMEWADTLSHDEISSLIEQVKAGLLTPDEAREQMKRAPAEWPDELGPDEIASLIEQVKSGLLTLDEARAKMKLPAMVWSDDLSPEESGMLIEQVKAGLRTEDEARALMKLAPIQWPDTLTAEDIASLIKQVESGLLTYDEAREQMKRPPIAWPAEDNMSEKIEHLGGLIKAGFDPMDALRVLGLPPIKHLGLPPITVQKVGEVAAAEEEPAEPIAEEEPMPDEMVPAEAMLPKKKAAKKKMPMEAMP